MRTDFYFDSHGSGKIHGCRWEPEGRIRGVVQIIHGIAEYVERYDHFAGYLNSQGYLVVGEDHMGHGDSDGCPQGYFVGGWQTAVDDSYQLLRMTRQEFPDLPYVLLGHSMGSFMARTILCKYPDSGISGCILSGTGWQPRSGLPIVEKLCRLTCRKIGEKTPSPMLDRLIFGGYNQKIPSPRTRFDWLSTNSASVDAYLESPKCGFLASAGLMRDLMQGLMYIEDPENLDRMDRKLPVFFVAGDADPVGSYGKGVVRAAKVFQDLGMEQVTVKLYGGMRHEILNETDRETVYRDLDSWIENLL